MIEQEKVSKHLYYNFNNEMLGDEKRREKVENHLVQGIVPCDNDERNITWRAKKKSKKKWQKFISSLSRCIYSLQLLMYFFVPLPIPIFHLIIMKFFIPFFSPVFLSCPSHVQLCLWQFQFLIHFKIELVLISTFFFSPLFCNRINDQLQSLHFCNIIIM